MLNSWLCYCVHSTLPRYNCPQKRGEIERGKRATFLLGSGLVGKNQLSWASKVVAFCPHNLDLNHGSHFFIIVRWVGLGGSHTPHGFWDRALVVGILTTLKEKSLGRPFLHPYDFSFSQYADFLVLSLRKRDSVLLKLWSILQVGTSIFVPNCGVWFWLRRCHEYWEERLQSERVERIKQAKQHWETQCRAFMGVWINLFIPVGQAVLLLASSSSKSLLCLRSYLGLGDVYHCAYVHLHAEQGFHHSFSGLECFGDLR